MRAENPMSGCISSQNTSPQLPSYIDDSWRQWIATNMIAGLSSESLIQSLVANGISQETAMQEVALAAAHPYVLAGKGVNEKLKKRDWVLNSLSKLQEMSPYYGQVDRRFKLSRDEFFEKYYFANRPVVIKGMLEDWPALTQWTPEYLKRQCGDQLIEAQYGRNNSPNYEMESAKFKKQMAFSEYIDLINSCGPTNDFYMTANNTNLNGQALKALWKDVPLISEYLKVDNPTYQGFFWYGPPGTVTPLHHDLTNNFMAQIQGSKLVRMIPPNRLPNIYNHHHCYSNVDLGNIDYAQYPEFRGIKIIDVLIEPGDLLFLPVGYWHYVLGLERSITMTYTNFLHNNDFYSFYNTMGDI